MFDNLIPVSPVTHLKSGWLAPDTYHFASTESVLPVVISEVMMLKDMPLAFVQKTPESPFNLVAIQSLHPGYNLYVNESGNWLGRYLPLFYRSFPFCMMPIENSDQTALCVQQGSYFNETCHEGNTRLFDDAGEMTESMSQQLSLVKMFDKGLRQTQSMISLLVSMDLIVPWDLYVQAGEVGTAKKIQGLFHIDENALYNLPPESLKKIMDQGAMALIYGQMFSEHCVEFLGVQYRTLNEKQKLQQNVSLDSMFNENDDEMFKFD